MGAFLKREASVRKQHLSLEGRGSELGVVMRREFQEEGKAGAKAWGSKCTCCRRNMKEAGGAGAEGGGVREITGFWNTQEVLS